MEIWQIAWALTGVAGLVVSGLVGSAYALIEGEPPGLGVFARRDLLLLSRTLALVVYAPLGLLRAGLEALGDEPVFGIILVGFAAVWSFMQGVFILTTFFGFT